MSVVFVLVFVAIIMASAFLFAFIWAVKNGQYEDTYTPSVRMLFDDPAITPKEKIDLKEKSRSDQSQFTVKNKAQEEEEEKA
jgi:cbb3-type cytochrome oxidase maturation protein